MSTQAQPKTSKKLDVLVVGFGAVGAIYAMILKKSGLARVTVVARSNYDAAHKHGTHIKSEKYGNYVSWRPDRLCKSVEEASDHPFTHVIITTKAVPELLRTSRMLSPLLSPPFTDKHPQPIYVALQNGLNVENDLYVAIEALKQGEPKILGAAVYIGVNVLDDGVVEHKGFNDRISIGMYRHNDYKTIANSPDENDILENFGNALNEGGNDVSICPEMQRIKFAKNFWNIAFSSLATLTGYTLPSIFRSPPIKGQHYAPYVYETTSDLIEKHTLPQVHAVLNEMLYLARAMGFPDEPLPKGIPSSIVEDTMNNTRRLHQIPESTHKPSMMLDAENGRPLEVEVILGEVVRLARRYKVEVPRIEMMYALILVKQNQTLRLLEEKRSHRP